MVFFFHSIPTFFEEEEKRKIWLLRILSLPMCCHRIFFFFAFLEKRKILFISMVKKSRDFSRGNYLLSILPLNKYVVLCLYIHVRGKKTGFPPSPSAFTILFYGLNEEDLSTNVKFIVSYLAIFLPYPFNFTLNFIVLRLCSRPMR